jgi:hydroxymethylglutaryl-CoA lyase
MAQDELVGNLNTEAIVSYFEEKNMLIGLNKNALKKSLDLASEIFV